MSIKSYVLFKNNSIYGPYSEGLIREKVEAKDISLNHYLYNLSTNQWELLGNIEIFGDLKPICPEFVMQLNKPHLLISNREGISGPYLYDEIEKKINLKELGLFDYIFISGLNRWKTLEDLGDFNHLLMQKESIINFSNSMQELEDKIKLFKQGQTLPHEEKSLQSNLKSMLSENENDNNSELPSLPENFSETEQVSDTLINHTLHEELKFKVILLENEIVKINSSTSLKEEFEKKANIYKEEIKLLKSQLKQFNNQSVKQNKANEQTLEINQQQKDQIKLLAEDKSALENRLGKKNNELALFKEKNSFSAINEEHQEEIEAKIKKQEKEIIKNSSIIENNNLKYETLLRKAETIKEKFFKQKENIITMREAYIKISNQLKKAQELLAQSNSNQEVETLTQNNQHLENQINDLQQKYDQLVEQLENEKKKISNSTDQDEIITALKNEQEKSQMLLQQFKTEIVDLNQKLEDADNTVDDIKTSTLILPEGMPFTSSETSNETSNESVQIEPQLEVEDSQDQPYEENILLDPVDEDFPEDQETEAGLQIDDLLMLDLENENDQEIQNFNLTDEEIAAVDDNFIEAREDIYIGETFEVNNNQIWQINGKGKELYSFEMIYKLLKNKEIDKKVNAQKITSKRPGWHPLGEYFEFSSRPIRKKETVDGRFITKYYVKRQDFRAKILSKCIITINNKKINGICSSISTGGSFIELDSIDENIFLLEKVAQITIEDMNSTSLTTDFIIRNIKQESPMGIGIQFKELTPKQLSLITDYVQDYIGEIDHKESA